jgi:hypothetical protein
MQTNVLDLQLYCKRHYVEHVSGLTGPSLGTTLIVQNDCSLLDNVGIVRRLQKKKPFELV